MKYRSIRIFHFFVVGWGAECWAPGYKCGFINHSLLHGHKLLGYHRGGGRGVAVLRIARRRKGA